MKMEADTKMMKAWLIIQIAINEIEKKQSSIKFDEDCFHLR